MCAQPKRYEFFHSFVVMCAAAPARGGPRTGDRAVRVANTE